MTWITDAAKAIDGDPGTTDEGTIAQVIQHHFLKAIAAKLDELQGMTSTPVIASATNDGWIAALQWMRDTEL